MYQETTHQEEQTPVTIEVDGPSLDTLTVEETKPLSVDEVEEFAHENEALDVPSEQTTIEIPEGWMSIHAIAKTFGKSYKTVSKSMRQALDEHPEWSDDSLTHGGARYFPPTVAYAVILDIHTDKKTVPKGWMTANAAVAELGISWDVFSSQIDSITEEHPEWTGEYRTRQGSFRHYSPEVIAAMREGYAGIDRPPEGWMTASKIANALGVDHRLVKDQIAAVIEEHPEWTGEYRAFNGVHAHYSPEAVELMRQVSSKDQPPEGWMTVGEVVEALGLDRSTVDARVKSLLKSNPGCSGMYRAAIGDDVRRLRRYISPEAIGHMRGDAIAPVPDDWQTLNTAVKMLGMNRKALAEQLLAITEEHPEWSGTFRASNGIHTYYSPEAISTIHHSRLAEAASVETQPKDTLEQDMRGFARELAEGQAVEADEFRKLTQLFGAERTMDILYQFRPEYKKISVPYVRSVIADYLGDFMNVRGELNLDTIAEVEAYLADKNLRQGMVEVVKDSCLRHFNLAVKGNDGVGLEVITDYLNSLRLHGGDLQNDYFIGVLDEVEDYYRSAFEDISLPEDIVSALRANRLFPDLNQRINIKEIAEKHKMLIADEMGVGKSASAILAKEHLGVKQALIVAPSNVLDTWMRYLSSQPGIDDYPAGYFKPGQEPNVLYVDSPEQLEGDLSQYDYVLLSQERLTEKTVAALGNLDYGMLIVDEAHKLKNLSSGKRADLLVELASKIDDDKYLALLSGTPVPNKVGDVAMILKLLYPEKFADVANKELVRQIIKGDVLDLRSLLVPRMEMKALAESVKMPDLQEIEHKISLSAEEEVIYEMLVDEDELTASQKLQLLRQFVMNPNLVELAPDVPGSKLQAVAEQLRETFAEKDKVVMFVNGYIDGVIRGEQTILEQLGLPEGVRVLAIHGDVSKEERTAIEAQLRTSGQKILLAVSGQTADVGVDFSGAEEVFFYNEPWTKYDKKQQLGRVYRPGLQAGLISRTFIADGTIEEGISKYIESKYQAIEKLLRGIPLSEIERELVRHDEQADPDLEVDADLADYYFSSWDRMMKIYKHVKEMGEENFTHFLGRYGQEYAECYADLGSRSYQANASRLSGTVLNKLVTEKKQKSDDLHILDIASGPEMLRHHAIKQISDRVYSVDINQHHFSEAGQRRMVGSFLRLPVASGSMDYANLSLALHYTNFLPSKGNYERLEVLRELNRVLKVGGSGIINMMYTLDFKSEEGFREVAEKAGFKVVERYSGEVVSGQHFRTRMVTLEKVRDCTERASEICKQLSPSGVKGLKLKRLPSKIRDSRKIVADFVLNGSTTLKAQFNEEDREVVDEERLLLRQMNMLRKRYGDVKNIPVLQIKAGGFARFFNGKSYVLFKRLATAGGAVIIR